jgi:hypothetical protein
MVLQCQEQKVLGSVTGNDPISNPGEIIIDPLSAFPKHFKGLEILINESYWYNPIYKQIYDDGLRIENYALMQRRKIGLKIHFFILDG